MSARTQSERRKTPWPWLLPMMALIILAGLGYFFTEGGADALAEARAAYARGDWSQADALARAILLEHPDNLDAVRVAARAAARLNRDDVARRFYARLGGPEGLEADDFHVLGLMMERGGGDAQARQAWTMGRQADPKHGEILEALAQLELKGEQLLAAEEIAEALAAIPGAQAKADRLLAEIAERKKDPDAAVKALKRLIAAEPDAGEPSRDLRKRLARALLSLGRAEEARGELREVIAGGPDPEASWLLGRAELQLSGGKPDAAKRAAMPPLGEAYRAEHPETPEPAVFVGAERCGECHKANYKSQQSSLHARTFRRAEGLADLKLPDQPVPDPYDANVVHELAPDPQGPIFQTKIDGEVFRAVVQYAFGSGDRGLTLVGLDDSGQMRECRLSHYADHDGWDMTTGQIPEPKTHREYLGRELDRDGVRRCVYCHVTDTLSVQKRQGPTLADHGIGCERCHGPGGNHVLAAAAELPDLAIAHFGAATGRPVLDVCAQCHGPLGQQLLVDDPSAPRFQAPSLKWSRCYAESQGKLDCKTCHAPHRDAETSTRFYERKCLSCHEESPNAICPVNPREDCLKCHMPKVETGGLHTSFTDHFIRVRP